MKELEIIGRTAITDFPEFGIGEIASKIDTGAYTSSIHCSLIEKTGEDTVRFIPLDSDHPSFKQKTLEFPIVKETIVKSSNGETEKRYMIRTKIRIMDKTYRIYLTLTYRGDMKYPVLIGRRFLANKFIVDVRKYI